MDGAVARGRRLRVVIADDEADVVFLLRMQLQRSGFEVVGTAADGAGAVAQARAGEADAVVMDLLMPGMNGFEAINVAREQLPHVAVVAYTAVAGQFVREEMARLGIPLVLKSGQVDRLAEAIRAAVEERERASGPPG